VWARIRLDIAPADLAFGVFRSLIPDDRNRLLKEIESFWDAEANTIVSFSVRSGFDLLLQALALPPKSEILFSALNIKGMIKIAKRHELVPVPVDLDREHMGPNLEILERAITPQTRAIVVAHLFGTRLNLDPLCALAKRHNLFIIEDCAQAFDGPAFAGHPEADASLFSFGPLKTSTALGGALLRIRDLELAARMRTLQSSYPIQSQKAYLKRILKFGAFTIITSPTMFGWVAGLFRLKGEDYEDAISDKVREVASLGSAKKMRQQPSTALCSMMHRRLRAWKQEHLSGRIQAGESLLASLKNVVVCPGIKNPLHTFWVFPILAANPKEMIAALRKEGFDGATLSRSEAVSAPDDRPELDPEVAKTVLAQMIILPCYAGMPADELAREAQTVIGKNSEN
jgi:dTDP-4-amino-4,6-dideoxygalactose transaminase